jgi:superfamily II DNA/RNA helicase
LGGVRVEEYSGRVDRREREQTIRRFEAGETQVLVCSDAITRGIDIPNVELVINYDAPVYAKTYVHRAGRTARAGREGKVVTMLRKEDVRHFKDMLRKADNNYVKDETVAAEGGWGERMKAWQRLVEDGLQEMMLHGEGDASGGGVKREERVREKRKDGASAHQRQKRKAYAKMRLPELCCM